MIKFTATKLQQTNKKGILTPDEDGYYDVILGGLNVYNSARMYYELKGAEELFNKSSMLMRRIKTGCLKIEVGHPDPSPGMSENDWLRRIHTIDPKNVCGHISDIWLDYDTGDIDHIGNGKDKPVLIWGKVAPSGPHADALDRAFKNTKENVCFSIRSLCKQYTKGSVIHRVLDIIITFDWVIEPGIKSANLWSNPGLETSLESLIETDVSLEAIREITNVKEGMALEDHDLLNELKTTLSDETNMLRNNTILRW